MRFHRKSTFAFYLYNQDRATQWTLPAVGVLVFTAFALVWVGFTGAAPRDVQSGLAAAPLVLLLLTVLAYLVDRSLQNQVPPANN